MKLAIRSFLIVFALYGQAFAQTAALLPMAVQQFFDNNGNPLSSGTVTTYAAGTSTLKTTWRNSGETIANTNPIILDAGGKAIIYGDGVYRQVVRDRNGNLIWDAVTSASGSGGATLFGDGTAVGTILPWSGIVAPSRYVFTYGQELSRVTYLSLYSAITLNTNVSCGLGSPVLAGISDTTQISIGSKVEATCIPSGTTILSKTSSTVTVSNNSTVNVATTARFFPWGNGNGTTTFNVPDLRGKVLPGRDNMGGTASAVLTSTYYGTNPDALAASGGTQFKALATTNLPAYTPAGTIVTTSNVTDPGHTHGVSTGALYTFGGSSAGVTTGTGFFLSPASISSATTGITVASTSTLTGTAQGGVATAFSLIQPSITMNYVIKILPDTNISTLNVVTSLGGMVGDIVCGTGLTCGSQTISVTTPGGTGVFPVSNPKGLDLTGPGIMGVSGVPDGGGGQDNSGLYTGDTVFASNYGKFVTGLDPSGDLIYRSIGTLSQSVDGRSLPGFPGGDLPPFALLPYYAVIAADAPVGLPTLAFGNMAAPDNQKWTFINVGNDGNLQIGPNADSWVGDPTLTADSPQYALIMRRSGYMPTSIDIVVPLTVGTRPAFGHYTTNNTNPANGSTLTINGTVVTFVASAPSGNQVLIGASARATLQNLRIFASASANANISQANYASDGNFELNIQYKTVAIAGNSFTIVAGAGSNYTASGATLTGAGGFGLAVTGDAIFTGTSALTVGGLLTVNGGIVSTTQNYMTGLQMQSNGSTAPNIEFRNLNAASGKQYISMDMDSSGTFHMGASSIGAISDFLNVTTNANLPVLMTFAVNVRGSTLIGTTCVLVGSLPAGTAGDRACVSDQMTSCPANGAALTGGGAVTCPAFKNASAWVGG